MRWQDSLRWLRIADLILEKEGSPNQFFATHLPFQLQKSGGEEDENVWSQSAYAPGSYRFPAQTVFQPSSAIVVVGGCPACRVGVLEESFTCLGILLAILLFPIGFICCFALRRQKCPNCGVVYF
ncbi:brain protein I3 isoform X2 [Trichosurus vulpecula]|uniref:brain protein I3 isoform X2 n=1 Tax=Trichosurus vulpecula TaxID=9337 RepID=UPI00186ACE77|nr:brain protein I3 isoform X2 [Trichosurus vulpecula]